MTADKPILCVQDLKTHFYTSRGVVKAVDGVSFSIGKGKVLGLVGETGCGKSVTALSIMRLIESPGRIVAGNILLDGIDLLSVTSAEMRNIRGNDVSLIFQQPRAALNPVYNVGYQIVEAIRAHRAISKSDANGEAEELLRKLELPEPAEMMSRYPFELSGGMAQRIVIAIAMASKPKLLIADEPTSALDVTVQAQILNLIKELIRETGASVLSITHDLGVAAELCDEIAVLYAGKIVEIAPKELFFKEPRHPYTEALLKAIPRRKRYTELYQIEGEVPDIMNLPKGCSFHPRCAHKMDICKEVNPELKSLSPASKVSCHLYGED